MDLPGGAVVTMIPSLHGRTLFGRAPYPGEIVPGQTPPLKASDYRHGQVFILRLEIGGMSYLHVGSCNLIDSEQWCFKGGFYFSSPVIRRRTLSSS